MSSSRQVTEGATTDRSPVLTDPHKRAEDILGDLPKKVRLIVPEDVERNPYLVSTKDGRLADVTAYHSRESGPALALCVNMAPHWLAIVRALKALDFIDDQSLADALVSYEAALATECDKLS